MVDLDYVNIDSVNCAVEHIEGELPLRHVAIMSKADAAAYLDALDAHIDAYVGILGALRSGRRAWLDVLLADGRWVGRWFDEDESATHAAISCGYWFHSPITAAGVGLKDSIEAEEDRKARAESGDLLVLLGDSW